MQIFLEKKGIQTRPIFTGNLLRHPMMRNKIYRKTKNSSINSDNIMKNGILVGCHQGLDTFEINFIIKQIKAYLKSIGLKN